ncbi:MAG: type III-B CRISPR module RAMP protein Cmr6 [Methylococcales bacterium]
MTKSNTGYLFYRKYFKETPGELDTDLNAEITAKSMVENVEAVRLPSSNKMEINQEPFRLTTIYPGLLTGSGYSHNVKGEDSKDTDNAFKLGFFFDHTTGMPVILGSSVKGVLRSLFPSKYKKRVVDDSFRDARYELIAEFINELTELKLNRKVQENRNTIDDFEAEIFDGMYQKKSKTIYSRDIFFDAVPVGIGQNFRNSETRLFGNDYITPHKHRDKHRGRNGMPNGPELDPFSNPTPIQFLKVMPSVTYEFRFCLHKSCIIAGMDASKKRELFKKLILFSGIGAKTNVGYGQFKENPLPNSSVPVNKFEKEEQSSKTKGNRGGREERGNSNPRKTEQLVEKTENRKPEGQPKPAPITKDETWVEASTLKQGSEVTGTVCSYNHNGSAKVLLHIHGYENERSIDGKYEVGQKVQLKITGISWNKQKN